MKPYYRQILQAIAIIAVSIYYVGLVYISTNLHQKDIHWVEPSVVSKNLHQPQIGRPLEIDWVEAGAVSPVVRKQNKCGKCLGLS
jgi:hypothetical protein